VLHGHNHLNMLAVRLWRAGEIPVVGVASASVARGRRREALGRYNLIRIATGEGGARIELIGRGLNEPGGSVVELERRTLSPNVEQTSPRRGENLGSAAGDFVP
jgi:hypothetical protein